MDNPATAGEHVRQLRRQAHLSQLDLALITGISQRHLSCLETGRAKPSPGTLHNLLNANNPAPAILLGSEWQVLAANTSTAVLFGLVGINPDAADGVNLLSSLLQSGGLGDHLINAEEIRTLAWQRATREALGNPALAALLASLPVPVHTELPTAMPPLVLTRVRSTQGELNFLSTFTTFGMPQDITLASLRIEHLIPADDFTWQVMRRAFEGYAALVL